MLTFAQAKRSINWLIKLGDNGECLLWVILQFLNSSTKQNMYLNKPIRGPRRFEKQTQNINMANIIAKTEFRLFLPTIRQPYVTR